MADEKVTIDAVQKAKELLGLAKADTSKENNLEKGKMTPEVWVEKATAYQDALTKSKEFADKAEAMKAELKAVNMGDPDGDKSKWPAVGGIQMGKAEDVELKKAEEEKIKKAQEASNDLFKGFTDQIQALGTLITAKEEENTNLKKSVEEAVKGITDVKSELEAIKKINPGPRSIVKSYTERFSKAADDEKELSISRNKREVVDALVKAAGDNFGPTNIFAKAASNIEMSGMIGSHIETANIIDRLRKEQKILITA